jgi:hypothetical protein
MIAILLAAVVLLLIAAYVRLGVLVEETRMLRAVSDGVRRFQRRPSDDAEAADAQTSGSLVFPPSDLAEMVVLHRANRDSRTWLVPPSES